MLYTARIDCCAESITIFKNILVAEHRGQDRRTARRDILNATSIQHCGSDCSRKNVLCTPTIDLSASRGPARKDILITSVINLRIASRATKVDVLASAVIKLSCDCHTARRHILIAARADGRARIYATT